jgi:ligand-binding sensor domain-containing protein/signal transduction histidine kinase/DNA-binding response OmpR family regulator
LNGQFIRNLTGRFFLLLCFLAVNRRSNAQSKLIFEHLNVENGLSQSSVLAITQDARGYLWFGTRGGLNKYTGNNFTVYKGTALGLRDGSKSVINALLVDNKNRLWVGTGRGLRLYRPESDSFISIVPDPNNKNSLSGNGVNSIIQDKAGDIWVGTNSGLNRLVDSSKFKFEQFHPKGNGLASIANDEVKSIFQDAGGVIWVGTSNGLTGISKIGKAYHFITYRSGYSTASLSDNNITSIIEDKQHKLWIGTQYGGLNAFDSDKQLFEHYKSDGTSNSLLSNNIRKLILDDKGMLWIATLRGLNILDPTSKKFYAYRQAPQDTKSLSHNSIYSLFQDKNKSVWVGTYFGGLNVVHGYVTPFNVLQSNDSKNSLSSNIVSNIIEDKDKNLWIGTEAEGVNYFDQKSNRFTQYKTTNVPNVGPGSNLVKSIFKDKQGLIWIGGFDSGLNKFDPHTSKFTYYRHNPLDPRSISSNNITSILEDTEGRFWVGTEGAGINLFDKVHSVFKHITKTTPNYGLVNDYIQALYQDKAGNLWIGTQSGLNLLKKNTNKLLHFLKGSEQQAALASDNINCIKEDKEGRIWIGTDGGGLSEFLPQTATFKNYNQNNCGLPNNNILNILEDRSGHLWISTENGLARFSPERKKTINYFVQDGLPTNVFNYNSSFKDAQGILYFGSYNGLVSFDPDLIKENTNKSAVVFTGLKLFNTEIKPNDDTHLLSKDISLTKYIELHHNQNILTIEFSILNYIKPYKNRFAYKLAGFEKSWNYVTTTSATYTNLPPGSYNFIVKGANNDGNWSDSVATLNIRILPPIWKTWWAYSLYVILFVTMLFFLMKFLLYRAHLKREHEIDQLKLDFFTNISHEIRTPLTLILGPLENLLLNSQHNPVFNKQLANIKNNADRLLRLVSELLDFRKAETGNLTLYVTDENIIKFSKEVFLSFQYTALSRAINYEFIADEEELNVCFDKDQFEKVLFNLLSNAFKFTPDGGKISMSIKKMESEVFIDIRDNGTGIPLESHKDIFKDFYQVKAYGQNGLGTGIGLALSKKIVELHYGSISFDSKPAANKFDGRTVFFIRLKLGRAHFKKENLLDVGLTHVLRTIQPEQLLPVTEKVVEENESLFNYTILVIDDNHEVRAFLKDTLSVNYQIILAENGQEGLDMALTLIPDIIISDVMMPVMDGLELCRNLKTDQRTSHIPVILLTARAAFIHQVNGLQLGADAYITKPFSVEIIALNVRNLLSSREVMRTRYSQQIVLQPRNITVSTADARFMEKMVDYIEEHLSDPEFGVPMLASETAMSQPVLYKKLKALTGLSVNDFIKSIRLKKAAQLLRQKELNVYEVANAVGFNDRKYFSQEFKKQFGRSPSDYITDLNISSENQV